MEIVIYEVGKKSSFELITIEGSVWMTMQQMSMVFEVDRSVIGKHIRNIYSTGELDRDRTWAKIAQVRTEGGRKVSRDTDFYNLDMVIAVGYRENSLKATKYAVFRRSYVLRNFAWTVPRESASAFRRRDSPQSRSHYSPDSHLSSLISHLSSLLKAPNLQRSTFPVQLSTFNVQLSTFNLQRSTFNPSTFHVFDIMCGIWHNNIEM